ncbi:MAG: ATP-dependent DNA helicase RecG [Bacteroidia bacterium]|nr:ATP-dependent DNA helicase RecG [Bacteroidia bacterium]
MQKTLETSIEFLKGVGPARAELLRKELDVKTFNDLLWKLPFRYINKGEISLIKDIRSFDDYVQIKGILERIYTQGEGRRIRLHAILRDGSGFIELVWFQGVKWIKNSLLKGKEYIVYGKINNFKGQISIPHPELELSSNASITPTLEPVYHGTETLTKKGLDNRSRRILMRNLLEKVISSDIPEIIPTNILKQLRLMPRYDAIKAIHFPKDSNELKIAAFRIKFEEFYLMQLRLLRMKVKRTEQFGGFVFPKVGHLFNTFYKTYLPFELTKAQKKVIKEIRKNLGSGVQMNRLLQGDVGSGKTIVSLLTMILAIDNDFQAVMMAPTQVLAQQHFRSLSTYLQDMDIQIAFLTGNVKGKQRKQVLEGIGSGAINILVGTHAILEDPVQFKNLGIAITDEQHRFGVKQRAKLWSKSTPNPPHILVMTATPIPRTLAMTLYGDLDISVIDELPPGRKEIITMHKSESSRLWVIGLMKKEIAKGRQVYIVYPLIQESEKMDLLNLQQGYDTLRRDFPISQYQISVVHGQMKAEQKDFEMSRFIKNETQIMIATTVIEVGVDIPNASLMVIENAERFGLSQLHQLRGRVGRSGQQSYCILLTSYRLSKESKFRLKTMVETNDGFKIAEADLKLRGPGNIEGLQQSGIVDFQLADIAKDNKILLEARHQAMQTLELDPHLNMPQHHHLAVLMKKMDQKFKLWSKVS